MKYAVLAGLIIISAIIWALAKKTRQKNGTNNVIGETGIVIEEITNEKISGRVKVAGQEWFAETENGEEIPKNSKVLVKGVYDKKLVVEAVRFPSLNVNK